VGLPNQPTLIGIKVAMVSQPIDKTEDDVTRVVKTIKVVFLSRVFQIPRLFGSSKYEILDGGNVNRTMLSYVFWFDDLRHLMT
jgi:hypothetical protein